MYLESRVKSPKIGWLVSSRVEHRSFKKDTKPKPDIRTEKQSCFILVCSMLQMSKSKTTRSSLFNGSSIFMLLKDMF